MVHSRWWAVLAALLASACPAPASALGNVFKRCSRDRVDRLNATLGGRVLDYTSNHGADRRIWSPALCQKRDMYVYLPPGYDGRTPFPVMYWLHGFGQDEKNFLDLAVEFDRAIRCGRMPPMIVLNPDGSLTGNPSPFNAGSFYINSKAGRYQDFAMQEIWEFATRSFCIHPDRGAHVLAGASMGGFAAYNCGFKYRERFGVLVGLMPPLSLRYSDCHGRYFAPYDPHCVMNRDRSSPHMAIGRFYGVVVVRERRMTGPLVESRPHNAMPEVALQNPIEMLDAYEIGPNEFAMYVGYAGKDEFNLGAQALHFADRAAARGIAVTVESVPDGNHSTKTGYRLMPGVEAFLLRHVGAYAPPVR